MLAQFLHVKPNMKLYSLYAGLICLISFTAHAQYFTNQNKVWVFGGWAGLDFNSGSPVPIHTNIDAFEGSASLCSSSGSLMFYTQGEYIVNSSGGHMPSSGSMLPIGNTYSTTQASVIAPCIGHPSRYYVFALSAHMAADTVGSKTSYLCYSIVDMSLDGGAGDVVLPYKGIIIDSMLSEKMITVTGNNNNIWLLTHRTDSAIFYAYEITAFGIAPYPVVSHVGAFTGFKSYATGVLKVSPDRTKLVCQSGDFGGIFAVSYGTELFDFDANTGVVSNGMVLNSLDLSPYGAEFSPDGKKLYSNEGTIFPYSSKLYQYDLTSDVESTIISSKVLIATLPYAEADIKLAPNNRLYFKGADDSMGITGCSRFIDCIQFPNNVGAACGYISHAVTLLPGTSVCLGLSNTFVDTDTTSFTKTSIVFPDESISFSPNPCTAILNIKSESALGNITITNTIGQEVYNTLCSGKHISISTENMPPGVYFAVIGNGYRHKFVKN